MKNTKQLFYPAFMALCSVALFTACGKKKDSKPAYHVMARVDNLDGNEIQFGSSSGNTATLTDSSSELNLHFVDSKVKLTMDIVASPVSATGDFSLTTSVDNDALLNIGSNPSGKQVFCTCTDVNGDGIPDGHGMLTITSLTNDHITGTFDQVAFLSTDLSLPAVLAYDGKFDLELVRN